MLFPRIARYILYLPLFLIIFHSLPLLFRISKAFKPTIFANKKFFSAPSAPAGTPKGYREKTSYEIWFGDAGAYPGILLY